MALLFLHLRSLLRINHSGKHSPAAPQQFGGTTFFPKQHAMKNKSTQSLLQLLPATASSVTALCILTATDLLLTQRCQRQEPQLTGIRCKGLFPRKKTANISSWCSSLNQRRALASRFDIAPGYSI